MLRLDLSLVLSLALALVPAGAADVLVASFTQNRVRRYDLESGALIDDFVQANSGGLAGPAHMPFGPDGHLYVLSSLTSAVLRYDGESGAFLGTFVPPSAFLARPGAFVFGPSGDLYVASTLTSSVARFDGTSGAFLGALVQAGSGGLSSPRKLAIGKQGNLNVLSFDTGALLRFSGKTGAFLKAVVAPGEAGLGGPSALLLVPSPQALLLGPTPGLASAVNTLTTAFSTPGALVVFSAGTQLGAHVLPGPTELCLGILDPFLVGIAIAGTDGTAVLAIEVPVGASGKTFYVQALEPATGLSSAVNCVSFQ